MRDLQTEDREDMAPEEEIRLWREWFSTVGVGWDHVDDIEQELDR
jgi:hypothetical protein